MTSVFGPNGTLHPVTVVEAGPCVVVQKKTEETDGYDAIQVGYGEVKEKHLTQAMAGHFKKHGQDAKRKLQEFRDFEGDLQVGDSFDVGIFAVDDSVNVIARSKGKGFQGVVKRHGFGGVGMRTHGQHNRQRHPGSIGAASYPAKVFKGMRMAGQDGNKRVMTRNLRVMQVIAEEGLLLIKGSVPGPKGGLVIIESNAPVAVAAGAENAES